MQTFQMSGISVVFTQFKNENRVMFMEQEEDTQLDLSKIKWKLQKEKEDWCKFDYRNKEMSLRFYLDFKKQEFELEINEERCIKIQFRAENFPDKKFSFSNFGISTG